MHQSDLNCFANADDFLKVLLCVWTLFSFLLVVHVLVRAADVSPKHRLAAAGLMIVVLSFLLFNSFLLSYVIQQFITAGLLQHRLRLDSTQVELLLGLLHLWLQRWQGHLVAELWRLPDHRQAKILSPHRCVAIFESSDPFDLCNSLLLLRNNPISFLDSTSLIGKIHLSNRLIQQISS